jgi:thiol peroxidase
LIQGQAAFLFLHKQRYGLQKCPDFRIITFQIRLIMATITFKGTPIQTAGSLPEVGTNAPAFTLTGSDLSDKSLSDYQGKRIILNIFPSIDTGVCAASVRTFNQKAGGLENTVVLNISKDLPFAQGRFCGAEGIDQVEVLSEYKDSNFSEAYQLKIADGPLAGLLSRAVVLIDESGKVKYTEQVPEITQEPDYDKVLALVQ